MSAECVVIIIPSLAAAITAPITYMISRFTGIPVYRTGILYSGLIIAAATAVNVYTYSWAKRTLKRDKTAGAGVGIAILGIFITSIISCTSHLTSYWSMSYFLCNNSITTKSVVELLDIRLWINAVSDISLWEEFKLAFK